LTPENFQAGFITAEGWGTYTQTQSEKEQLCNIKIASGELSLKTFSFAIPKSKKIRRIKLEFNNNKINKEYVINNVEVTMNFKELLIMENDKFNVVIQY